MIIRKSRAFLLIVLLLMAAGTGVFLVMPSQSGDPNFDARIASPTYPVGSGPKVLIDEGHYNVHTSEGRYKPFADLLRNDGYIVEPHKGRFTATSLANAKVLVVANALGLRGAIQQISTIVGLEGQLNIVSSAFSDDERTTVEQWVNSGGSLLLVSDHAPAGKAAAALASDFGVEMSAGYTEDPTACDPETKSPGFLVFSRENGLLTDHPLTQRIDKIISFTGQSLKGPPGSVAFLRLGPNAKEYPRRAATAVEARNVGGLAQGIALLHGRGRVVVLGEAAMLTSQVAAAGNRSSNFGMSRDGFDDRQLCLNILRWLTS